MEDGRILSEEYTKANKARRDWFGEGLSSRTTRVPAMASAGMEIDDRHAFRVMVRSGTDDVMAGPAAFRRRTGG
jgi:hypothetical protein